MTIGEYLMLWYDYCFQNEGDKVLSCLGYLNRPTCNILCMLVINPHAFYKIHIR